MVLFGVQDHVFFHRGARPTCLRSARGAVVPRESVVDNRSHSVSEYSHGYSGSVLRYTLSIFRANPYTTRPRALLHAAATTGSAERAGYLHGNVQANASLA